MNKSLLCALLWAAGCASALGQGTTYTLAPVDLPNPDQVPARVHWLAAPPRHAGPMPEFRLERPWFGQLTLGDGPRMLVAVDESPGSMSPRPLLVYLDLNGDRSLADEQPLAATPQGDSTGTFATPRIAIPVSYRLADGTWLARDLPLGVVLQGR